MSIKLFLVAILLTSFSASGADWKKLKLVNGCRIFNPAGYMENAFPGAICIFLDNGNFISATDKAMRMINTKNEVVWEFPGHFHHQVNLSSSGDKILALASEISNGLREDIFYILDLKGKLLYSQRASEIYKLAGQKPLNWNMNPTTINGVTTSVEFSHFNSFYDVPALVGKKLPEWLKQGSIILNTSASGIFVLDPEMKKLLHHVLLPISTHHRVHDVQVKKNGNFLLFNNVAGKNEIRKNYLLDSRPAMYHSAVQEIDPVSLKVVEEFTANPKPMFYSWICGSVQELDNDTWLFTHFLSGTYIYSKSKKDFLASIPGTHADNERFSPTQQVKALDLTSFFRNRD